MDARLAVLLLTTALLGGCGASAQQPARAAQADAADKDAAAKGDASAGAAGKADDDDKSNAADKDDKAGAACKDDKADADDEADKADAAGKSDDDDKDAKANSQCVTLTAEQREKLGIATTPAEALTFAPAASGFGVVLDHEAIAQVAADLETAAGAAKLSQAALTRAQHLASGPGALGIDAQETFAKQASADQAALLLARRKLTATLGTQFPGRNVESNDLLNTLADGQAKLVRVTFPSGILSGGTPKTLQMLSLEPNSQSASYMSDAVWDAPQNASLPGRSFFALLKRPDVPEGSRLQVLPAASPKDTPGVLVPASAIVVSAGQYWCYLEKTAGQFVRISIDVGRPIGQGYFVSDGVAAGDRVVTSSAGLLLARQMNSGADAAD